MDNKKEKKKKAPGETEAQSSKEAEDTKITPSRRQNVTEPSKSDQKPQKIIADTIEPVTQKKKTRSAAKPVKDPEKLKERAKLPGKSQDPLEARDPQDSVPTVLQAQAKTKKKLGKEKPIGGKTKKEQKAETVEDIPQALKPPKMEELSLFVNKGDKKTLQRDQKPLPYKPPTFTGFRELPFAKIFLIILLWHPRMYIPYITAWHEFNVYIVSNPWHWRDFEGQLLQQKVFVSGAKYAITILSSVAVNYIRRPWKLEYYVYLVLLGLFSLSPAAGGFVDIVLRAGIRDEEMYMEWWFTSLALMQWAMSAAFMMFPVQFACIYAQQNNMSRNAHYNWVSIFVLAEFICVYPAFLLIPPPCPTKEWTVIVVWVGITACLLTTTILTVIFFFAIPALKDLLLICCKKKVNLMTQATHKDNFIDAPKNLRLHKLFWFSMIALPIVWSSFLFSIIERFAKNEDWDDLNFLITLGIFQFLSADWDNLSTLSAFGIFNLCKIIGVVVVALVMFVGRKVWARRYPSTQLRTEIVYLGLPHGLCILALMILMGRLASLAHLKENDVILGPIPDEGKAVMVFVNRMHRNRTICLSSKYFRSVRIRPDQYVSREFYDSGTENITVYIETDPRMEPSFRRRLLVKNIKRNGWTIHVITNFLMKPAGLDDWEYHNLLIDGFMLDVGNPGPKVGPPRMLIYEIIASSSVECEYFQMNHSSLSSQRVQSISDFDSEAGAVRKLEWVVPATGSWTGQRWHDYYNKGELFWRYQSNRTQWDVPLTFTVDNNSLYLLTESQYEEGFAYSLIHRHCKDPNPPRANDHYAGFPLNFKVSKLGEVAGANSDRLPLNKVLQQDWAVKICLALAGMANGGIHVGFLYLFWVDPPLPRFQVTSLAICWVLMGVASEIPRSSLIEIGVGVSGVLLLVQTIMTASHCVGAYYMFSAVFNFRTRPD